MPETIFKDIFSSNDPKLDVLFYNMNAEQFARQLNSDMLDDHIFMEIKRHGINDKEVIKRLLVETFKISREYQPDQNFGQMVNTLHGGYKKVMRKAIQKEEPTQADILFIQSLVKAQHLVSGSLDITIEKIDGKLVIHEHPTPLLLYRLARGIIDTWNDEKEIRICDASDCDVAFVPVRQRQKYCSRTCGSRMRKRKERNKDVTTFS